MGFKFNSFNVWKSHDDHSHKSSNFYHKHSHHNHHNHYSHNHHNHDHNNSTTGNSTIELSLLGTFNTGQGEGSSEIVAHDPISQRLFITNSETKTVDILDISNPKTPVKISSIDVSLINGNLTGGPNSVAIANGIVAIAVEADPVTDPGFIAFYDANGNLLGSVEVGSLPDMVKFTPDGKQLLVANEGEADNGIDPKGTISIIDISNGIENAQVTNLDFTSFDVYQDALVAAGVRIFDGKLLSDDVEPEYIAISEDGSKAFITLQEANSVAVLDIATKTIIEIQPLGAKDHSLEGNGLDASDKDGEINIETVPVFGLYMPDSIDSYTTNGKTYYVTANEGDARDEDKRVKKLDLDPNAFPDADELQKDENLGRLNVSTIDGDIDGDGDYDMLFAYGARSFTIWDENGNVVFDSGDIIAQTIAEQAPELFNANDGDPDKFDGRSDNKGAEPESIVVGEVDGKIYAFVGLERASGGIMVFDITNPEDSSFIQYIRTDGDIAPEGLEFISAKDSPIGTPLLAVANEVSGTTSLYQINFDGKTINGSHWSETLKGTGGDDNINGNSGNDTLLGFAGDDRLTGGSGNDRLDGGEGVDTIVFSGNRADYIIDLERGRITDINGWDGYEGVDRFENVEFAEFSDETVSLEALPLTLFEQDQLVFEQEYTPETGNHIPAVTVQADDLDMVVAPFVDLNDDLANI